MEWDTRVGCYAWIEREGRVLLSRWAGWEAPDGRRLRPCWSLPGGGLELHESCEQAVVREVAEETGYVARLEGLIGTGSRVVPTVDRYDRHAGRPFLLVQLVYRASITSGRLAVEVGGSTDDARWFEPDELDRVACSGSVDLALSLLGRDRRDGPVAEEEPVDEAAVRHVVEAVGDAPARCGSARVVAIDGPSGSGKTTLAHAVAQDLGCPVVHMDDLYPGWDGLAESVDLLTGQVLEPLCRGERAAYRVWDWHRGDWGRTATVPPTEVLVVEGCGSSVGRAGEYAAVRVWVDADAAVRLQRGVERDGEAYRPHWQRWAQQEQAVFAADCTREQADVVLDTTPRSEPLWPEI